MKKKLLYPFLCLFFLCSACTININVSGVDSEEIKETSIKSNSDDKIETVINNKNEKNISFDSSIPFIYTGGNKYLKVITDDLFEYSKIFFESEGVVEIPSPYIVEIDNSDLNDIKIYGDFGIYGYEMSGTIFHTKNGASNPGCYHLKEENGLIKLISREIAEDGSNNWSSLLKICNNDEKLAKGILDITSEEKLTERIDYAKMYAEQNNLRLSGIKDYGSPIILFDDIKKTEFVYNFYRAYFEEIREEDSLNDMVDRLDRLKTMYFSKSLIEKIDELTMDTGADMVINAQDVTEQMMDTLEAYDKRDGYVYVKFDTGEEKPCVAKVKVVQEPIFDLDNIDPELLKYMNILDRYKWVIEDIDYNM